MLILVPTATEATHLFEGALLQAGIPAPVRIGSQAALAALCGFGPAAAGVLAAQAIARASARGCLLLGIAGTYRPDRAEEGTVVRATEVRTADVGRGRGLSFAGPDRLETDQAPPAGPHPGVRDRIALDDDPVADRLVQDRGVFLTVASAAATPAEAIERLEAHPDALAEEMEGFPVALACQRAGVRLTVLRGISNVVGEPDVGRWDREGALAAVRAAAEAWIEASPAG